MDERPRTITELRGMTPSPTDRTKKYSKESYAAQYGITIEEADDLIGNYSSHPEVERAIFRMYSDNPALRDRAINWHKEEEEYRQRRNAEVDKERAEIRRKKIEEADRVEAEREKAKKSLANATTEKSAAGEGG